MGAAKLSRSIAVEFRQWRRELSSPKDRTRRPADDVYRNVGRSSAYPVTAYRAVDIRDKGLDYFLDSVSCFLASSDASMQSWCHEPP